MINAFSRDAAQLTLCMQSKFACLFVACFLINFLKTLFQELEVLLRVSDYMYLDSDQRLHFNPGPNCFKGYLSVNDTSRQRAKLEQGPISQLETK